MRKLLISLFLIFTLGCSQPVPFDIPANKDIIYGYDVRTEDSLYNGIEINFIRIEDEDEIHQLIINELERRIKFYHTNNDFVNRKDGQEYCIIIVDGYTTECGEKKYTSGCYYPSYNTAVVCFYGVLYNGKKYIKLSPTHIVHSMPALEHELMHIDKGRFHP